MAPWGNATTKAIMIWLICRRRAGSFSSVSRMAIVGLFPLSPVPKAESFDCTFQLSLTRSRTNEIKKRMKENPSLKYIASSSPFDFLPSHAQKNKPCVVYNLSFRVVRFRLTDSSFETVLTNETVRKPEKTA